MIRQICLGLILSSTVSLFIPLAAQATDEDLNVSAENLSTYADRHEIKVTVTDKDGNGVAGKWVFAKLKDESKGWKVGPTGADGMAKKHVKRAAIPNFEGSYLTDCDPKAEDGGSEIFFNSNTSQLSYTGGTIQKVFYSDGSNTSVNTMDEAIIGANVEVLNLSFLGIEESFPGEPVASFNEGTFRIFDSTGDFLEATLSSGSVFLDSLTNNSILQGELKNLAFDSSLTSRFIDEFSVLSSKETQAFTLEINGNLAEATNQYSADALLNGGLSSIGGTLSPIPVPEPLTILGAGTAAGFGAIFKRELNKKKKAQKDSESA